MFLSSKELKDERDTHVRDGKVLNKQLGVALRDTVVKGGQVLDMEDIICIGR